MATIQTNITIVENSSNGIQIKFEISNNGDNDVLILKRNTPLEGLKSDCLIVKVNGKKVSYDGYFLKRAAPVPEEFIKLKSGETATQLIDLSDAYDVSKPGRYEVKFDDSKLVVTPDKDPTIHATRSLTKAAGAFEVNNEQAAFIREEQAPIKETIGQKMRQKNKKKIEERAGLSKSMKVPKVEGGTPQQKKHIKAAHSNGYKYAKKAIGKLANDSRYKSWFGSHTTLRAKKVTDVYNKIVSRMENIEFTYRLNGNECDATTYGYTTIGGSVIWLCQMFWASPDQGFDSRAGTIVHEHSHASGRTDDFEYSQEECKQLALTKPGTAIKNADNYEFYAESHH